MVIDTAVSVIIDAADAPAAATIIIDGCCYY